LPRLPRPRLQVNVDHVATVRKARRAFEPDPVQAAVLAELAGAGGITVHLREDRRHIEDRDVEVLRRTVTTRLNLEMAATDEMVAIALAIRPDQVTLVPERRAELTTEGGLDVVRLAAELRPAVARLTTAGFEVSLFVAPEESAIAAARALGAASVELHTGRYAEALPGAGQEEELRALAVATTRARDAGLTVHLGHGLDYRNVAPVAALPGISDLNIGFSIVARAMLVGFDRAVRDMIAAIEAGLRPAAANP
jgi:pyridoxine 5-phosphate synthase